MKRTFVLLVALVAFSAHAASSQAGGYANAAGVIVAPKGFYHDFLREYRFVRKDCELQWKMARENIEFYDFRHTKDYGDLRSAVNKRLKRKHLGPSPAYDEWAYGHSFRLKSGKLVSISCPYG